jgi:hypothetical protein
MASKVATKQCPHITAKKVNNSFISLGDVTMTVLEGSMLRRVYLKDEPKSTRCALDVTTTDTMKDYLLLKISMF